MQLHPSSTRDRIDGDGEEEEGCRGGGSARPLANRGARCQTKEDVVTVRLKVLTHRTIGEATRIRDTKM